MQSQEVGQDLPGAAQLQLEERGGSVAGPWVHQRLETEKVRKTQLRQCHVQQGRGKGQLGKQQPK